METALEAAGFILGILYLWWEYHADNRVWLASMAMPLISMWIYFSKGIYADFGINIYYFLMSVYGYAAWRTGFSKAHKKPLQISHTPLWAALTAIGSAAALWLLLIWILSTFTDSTVPVADAFTTSLSIVGTWMLARKYAEQWIVWTIVDVVSAGLYLYKGLLFYPILYAIYTIVAIFGYFKWLRLMRQPTTLTSPDEPPLHSYTAPTEEPPEGP